MCKVLSSILVMVSAIGLASSPVKAAGLPLIISATVDYTHNTLTINGQNFGSYPTTIFGVDIGANGAQGPAGPQGPMGPQDVEGLAGPHRGGSS